MFLAILLIAINYGTNVLHFVVISKSEKKGDGKNGSTYGSG